MPKVFIEYQDQFNKWHQTHTKNNEADAYRVAKLQASRTGKRQRLIKEDGGLLDIIQ